MKNRIETTGRTPIIFYFALLLPPLISYLEYQLHQPSLGMLITKYGACSLFYLFCIDLINKQKFVVADNKVMLKVNNAFLNIEKQIAFTQIRQIENHAFLPKIKVIHH